MIYTIAQPDKIHGWPITPPGDWYVNFGIGGVFLGAALSGTALCAGDQAYGDRRLTAGALLLHRRWRFHA